MTNEVDISPTQQEALSRPSEPPEEDEASPLQMEALSGPSEPPEEDEASPLQMEGLSQPSELSEKNEASPLQMEALSRPSERSERNETSPLQMEALSRPSERSEKNEASTLQMEALSRPSEPPEKNEASPLQVEAVSRPSEHSEKNEAFPLQMEALSGPSEPPEEDEASPLQMEALSQASERSEKNETSPLQMEGLSRHSEPPEEDEASPLQMEALSGPSEPSEKNEASPLQMEAVSRPSEPPEKNEASPLQVEAVSRPSEHSEKNEAFPLQMEALSGPSEPPEEDEASPLQMEALSQASERSEKNETSPLQMEGLSRHSEPPEEDEASPLQMEALSGPSEPPEEDEASRLQMEVLSRPSERSEKNEASTLQMEALSRPSEPPEKNEASPLQVEAVSRPSEHSEKNETSPLQMEALSRPSERSEKNEASTLQMEALSRPSEPPEKNEASPLQMEAVSRPSEHSEKNETSPLQMEGLSRPSERFEKNEASTLQMDTLSRPSEPSEKNEASPLQMEALSGPSESPEKNEASPLQMEALAQPLEPPEEVQPSSIQQEAPTQAPEFPTIPVSNNIARGLTGLFEAYKSNLPSVTLKSLDEELTVTPEPTEDVESSTVQQEFPPQPPEPFGGGPSPSQEEASAPPPEPPNEAEYSPIQQETPAQFPKEVEPLATLQEPPAQPPDHDELRISTQAQLPESSPGVLDQPSVRPEVTLSPLGLGEAHHSTSPPVTISMDLGLSITPEPTEEIKTPSHQEAPSEAPEKTKSSPGQQGSPALPPKPLKEAEPSLTQQGVHTQPSEAPEKVEPSPVQQEAAQQSPETPKKVVVQPPLYQEVTVPTSGQDQAPHPLSPSVTIPPSDLGLIVTAEPTTEAKSSAALTKITAPSPRHLDVTLPHPEHVQSQHPNPTKVTLQPVDLDVAVTQQPESSETLPATTEQSASRNMDICKLCTCQDGMLSCTGLRPEQQLHRVPELESHSYNGTFTVVNLRGNSISYIDESVWKSYRWVEKLILSENNLTELHKDSFEGLLSLQYLDLSYNRIESVERHTFEPLPFLQYINLGGNSITELSFGTFQAWHGMQFLHKVILDRNPMTTVEDSYFFKLPALRYLDMGRTQVSLTTVESVLMMSLQLENLILPIRKTCCICQFKSDIEVVCETVKLHCDTECLTDNAHCDEEVSVGNEEGSFMKVLQARKKKTSTVLTIEPEKPSSHKYGINLAAFMNNQLDFSEENEAIRASNYILPYFSMGNLIDVESKLLPLIKLLFLSTEDGDMPLSHLTNNARNPFLKPESTGATYKNKLRKLNSLKNFLDAEIQEKKDEFKKKEKTAMLIHSNLLSSKLKRQIFQKELQTDQTQGYSLAKSQPVQKRLLRGNRVLMGPKGIRKRHFKEVAHQSIQKKQNAPPIVENTVKVRRLRGPPPRELGQLPKVHRPRKLVGNSFNTASSFVKEREAAVSSFLKQYLLGWLSASIAPKSLSKVKKSIDLSDTTFILDEANARVRNMKASKPISHSRKKHLFYKSSHVMHKATKSKRTQEFGKEDSLKRLMLAKRPPISALRSLINSPAREAFSSSGELISQENHLPESVSLLETSKEKSTAQIPFQEKISTQKATVPEKTTPEIPARENVFTTDSAVTADNFLPTVNQTHETQGEYPSVATHLLSNSTGFISPLFSSPGEQFENQLNQQLQFVIPNNEERKLIAHVIRTFKMDCSEVSVQLPCARLVSRTGLLMKRLSEQQEVKMYKAEWGIDLRKNENYISESTEARTEQKGQEPPEWTKVPTHRKQKKLILVICVPAVVTILIIIFCLIKILSHRRQSEEGKEGRSRGCFGFRRCKKNPSKRERQNSFWRQQPLWLQSTYIPLNDSRVKMITETLEDPDPSDEDETTETTDKIKGELREVIVDKNPE